MLFIKWLPLVHSSGAFNVFEQYLIWIKKLLAQDINMVDFLHDAQVLELYLETSLQLLEQFQVNRKQEELAKIFVELLATLLESYETSTMRRLGRPSPFLRQGRLVPSSAVVESLLS